jgi:chromosome segregation ATPase
MALVFQELSSLSSLAPADAGAEIRALRVELHEATALIVRAQVVVGQLEMVKRRINLLQAQVVAVRRDLAADTARKEKPAAALRSAEANVAAGLLGAEDAVSQLRVEVASIEQRERSLRAQEAELAIQLGAEEQRWFALSARLEELDRAVWPAGHLG